MFAASTWFAAGQPPPARPGQAGRWAAGRGRPAPWSRLSRMAIALHAQEGPTPYLVRDGSYFLPAAREITPCRSVLSQRDTEPGITEVLAKDAPGRTGHGHLMAGRHIAAGLPGPAHGSPEVFRLDGRAARIRSARCELCPHRLRARRQHRVRTPAGADWLAAPRGWRRHSGFDVAFSRRLPGGRLRSRAASA